jgi:LAS superfamily LD-carboxypeptidase LdcB
MTKTMNITICFILLSIISCNSGSKNANKQNDSTVQDSVTIVKEQKINEGEGIITGGELSKGDSSKGELLTTGIKVDSTKPDKKGSETVSTPYKDYLTGKTNFAKDSGFVKINPAYCSGRTIYLRTQTAEAFEKMRIAAKKDSITLIVLSGARSFEQQKNIWERKWNNLKSGTPKEKALNILRYSSMPMSSRHHWGTDIDLNNLENSYFERGQGLKIYKWLTENAPNFGFCQVYTDKKNGRTGYEMEKWHWSYMPLSRQVHQRYNKNVTIDDFKGFIGSETAKDVKILEDYVNGIEVCDFHEKELK